MATRELKSIKFPDLGDIYEVKVTEQALNTKLEDYPTKTELNTELTAKADAIVKSASGEVASFSDGGNGLLVKTLNVNIVPKQSGSGDPSPSNVRPISGYTDVNVNVAGGNLFDKALYPFLKDNDGKGWFIVGSRLRKGGGIENATLGMPCKPNTRYRITATTGHPLFRIAYGKMADLSFQTGSADQTIYNTQADTTTIGYREVIYQTGADATFLFIQFPYGYHTEGADSLIVEEIANTYPISLGQTVYGGTLDVVSGELTSFPYYSSYSGQTLSGEWICDRAVYSQGTTPPTGSQVVDMSGTGTTTQLTPTEVNTLLGSNNIWANAGTVEVEYRADTTLAYNELLSLIASLS